jgi:2-phospho-L-lactate/phosphoenolpyruvate guanylyltransferase
MKMSLCAIIPVKPLSQGKSRLSGILSEEKRIRLNKVLLSSTLNCLRKIQQIDCLIVVSYDSEVLMIARGFGAVTVLETQKTNINRALRKATKVAIGLNYGKVLIIPADLPFLNPDDIIRMINMAKKPPEIIIAPDMRETGTNILYINPIGAIKYKFGDESFKKHLEQAERKKVHIKIFRCEKIAFDLDLPNDWDFLFSTKITKNNHIVDNIVQEVGI